MPAMCKAFDPVTGATCQRRKHSLRRSAIHKDDSDPMTVLKWQAGKGFDSREAS